MNKVLIIDDDKELCALMKKCIEQEKLSAVTVYNGIEGVRLIDENKDSYSLIILDVMLPDIDGFQILQKIRDTSNIPVLMLTAKSSEEDKVFGLRLGADDYLTKPFVTGELLARIRALTRRTGEVAVDGLQFHNLRLDSQNYTLSYGQEQIKLSLKEYQIMEIFMSNPKQIVSKEFFIEKIWGYESDVEYNNIEVYISFLRKKLQSIHANISIKTARGIGYFLEEQPA